MTNPDEVPFGRDDAGNLVTIRQLDPSHRGANCGLVCPQCDDPLVARMGDQVRHHLAHASASDHQRATCSRESLQHLAIKEAVARAATLQLGRHEQLRPHHAVTERPAWPNDPHAMRPDVTITAPRTIALEVFVTNAKSHDDCLAYAKHRIEAWELDASFFHGHLADNVETAADRFVAASTWSLLWTTCPACKQPYARPQWKNAKCKPCYQAALAKQRAKDHAKQKALEFQEAAQTEADQALADFQEAAQQEARQQAKEAEQRRRREEAEQCRLCRQPLRGVPGYRVDLNICGTCRGKPA